MLYRLTADVQAWPTEAKRVEVTGTLMSMCKTVRGWRKFARYEDNYVLNMHVSKTEDRDIAHEADMAALRREQLRADITPEEANEELDLIPFDFDF